VNPSPQALIVGAGPTGLLLTVELARRGIDCLLIDALDAPRSWDRATVVHPRSMEIFEALGLADRFLDEGVKTRAARFRSDGETLGELNLALADSRYGFDLGISEEVTESVLTSYLERLGGAVTRSTRLVGLEPRPDGVRATLEQRGERSEVVASWVVACDGLRSAVRELVGVDFPGPVSLPLPCRRALPERSCAARRRRGPRVLAGRGSRDEHRSAGRLQSRLEARPRLSGDQRTGAARQL